MKKISVTEGKKRFRALVEAAAKGNRHIITKYKREIAIIISFEEYECLKAESGHPRSFS